MTHPIPDALALLAPARVTLEKMNNELNPMITYSCANQDKVVTIVLDGDAPVVQQVARGLVELRKEFGDAEWVCVTADAYAQQVKTREETYEGPRLSERFASGDPNVVEILTTMVITADLEWTSASQVHRTSIDGIEWDEPQSTPTPDDGPEGAIPKAIKGFFVFQKYFRPDFSPLKDGEQEAQT